MRKYYCNFRKMRPLLGFFKIYKQIGIDFNGLSRIDQIQASGETIDQMRMVIEKAVSRRYRYIIDQKRDTMVSFECLQWAPTTNNEIPFGEVWVYELDKEN